MKRILLLLLAATAAVSVTASSRTDGKQTLSGKPASFQGGDMFAFSRYVRENLTFSGDCYQEGDIFRLILAFRVAKNGKVKDVEVEKSSGDDSLDGEVLRIVRESTGWTARKDGAPDVRERLRMVIVLRRGTDGKLHAEDHFPYGKADTMPKFEGAGLGKFRRWIVEQVGDLDPEGAPIDARAALRFVIEKDGSLSEVSVDDRTPAWLVERIGKALDSVPRWTPAVMQGEKVRIQASLQLLFGKAAERVKADSPKDGDDAFLIVEQMPKFQGGDVMTFRNWVKINVKYPVDMYKQGIEGRVVATFIINRDGSLSDAKILQSSEAEFSREVLRVLERSPKWTPGQQKGEVVRVKYTIPVDFRIPAGREYRGNGRPANPSRTGRSQITQF